MVKLTAEQIAAVQQNPEGVSCEDATTHRVYVLVDADVHCRAMQALKEQQDLEAIQQGIAQMEKGGGTPLQEARQQLSHELGFPANRL